MCKFKILPPWGLRYASTNPLKTGGFESYNQRKMVRGYKSRGGAVEKNIRISVRSSPLGTTADG